MMKSLRWSLVPSLILIASSFYLFPGIHTDEAWLISSVSGISFEELLSFRINSYTSAFYPSIAYILVKVFGSSYYVLRTFNLISFILCFYITNLIYHKKRILFPLLWGTVVFSWPFIATFSRFSWELTALIPLLLLLAFYLFEMRGSRIHKLIAISLAALAANAHILGLIPVILFFAIRRREWRYLLIFLFMLIPLAYDVLTHTNDGLERVVVTAERLSEFPQTLYHLFFGSKLELQLVGFEFIDSLLWGIPSIVLLIALFARAKKNIIFPLFIFMAWALWVAIISPEFWPRYYVLPSFFLLVSLPLFLREHRTNVFLAFAIIVINVCRLSINFITPYLLKIDRGVFYPLTSWKQGTSFHFVSSVELPIWLEQTKLSEIGTNDWFVFNILSYYKINSELNLKIHYPQSPKGIPLINYSYNRYEMLSGYHKIEGVPRLFQVYKLD